MVLIKKLFVGLALVIGLLQLLVGMSLVWVVAVIPWLCYSIMAGMARLAGVNSMMYSLPEFIKACANPFD